MMRAEQQSKKNRLTERESKYLLYINTTSKITCKIVLYVCLLAYLLTYLPVAPKMLRM